MIAFIVIAVIIIIAIIYFVGKSKRSSQRSSSEQIVTTVAGKISRGLKATSEGLRDPRTVKAELLEALSKVEDKLTKSAQEYLTSILKNKAILETSLRSLEGSSVDYKRKAKDLYAKYKKDGKEVDLKYSKQFMEQAIACDERIIISKEKIVTLTDLSETAGYEFQIQMSKLTSKKTDIELLIADPSINIALELKNIQDLTKEFENKVQDQSISVEVSKKLGEESFLEDTHSVSEDELISQLEKL